MIGLLLKNYYLLLKDKNNMMSIRKHTSHWSTRPCAFCEAVDDEIIKALGTMVWISMPESVCEKCYGCRVVTDEEGGPKFFPSQRDHDVCCMMTREEQVDYISEDVIRKIITTPELSEELWKRVLTEFIGAEKRALEQILNNAKPEDRTVDEDWALSEKLGRITDYTKHLLKTFPLSSALHESETSLLKRKRDVDSD